MIAEIAHICIFLWKSHHNFVWVLQWIHKYTSLKAVRTVNITSSTRQLKAKVCIQTRQSGNQMCYSSLLLLLLQMAPLYCWKSFTLTKIFCGENILYGWFCKKVSKHAINVYCVLGCWECPRCHSKNSSEVRKHRN